MATGSQVWGGALVLSEYIGELALADRKFQGRHVIELGAGCGFCGLLAAKLGIHLFLEFLKIPAESDPFLVSGGVVTLTDRGEQLIELLEQAQDRAVCCAPLF